MAIDLAKLGITEESAPPVDWDAPEAGKQPPAIFPGTYIFLFGLAEDEDSWFEPVEREVVAGKPETKRTFLQLNYEATAIANSMKQPIANEDGSPLKLPPQRVNSFMSPKMRIHQLAELLRSCGVRLEGPISTQIEQTVREMNGKAQFEGEAIWRAYFQSTGTTISTSPRKGSKDGKRAAELPWPKDAQGQFELMATNPVSGEKAYGYVEITRFHAPTLGSEATAASAS